MADPFTDYTGGIGGQIAPYISGGASIIFKVIVGLLGVGVLVGLVLWYKNKKNYSIPITIWVPRSNNRIVDEVAAKGGYFQIKNKDGGKVTVFRVKRKGLGSVDIPPPSSNFLVGYNRKLYLLQKGIDDFEPVDPTHFRYVTTAKGRHIPIIDLKCINQDATAWVEDNRENAKRRFTFSGFWDKYKDFIQITIFLFIVFLAIYINWQGLKDVAVAMQNIADSLNTGVQVSGG